MQRIINAWHISGEALEGLDLSTWDIVSQVFKAHLQRNQRASEKNVRYVLKMYWPELPSEATITALTKEWNGMNRSSGAYIPVDDATITDISSPATSDIESDQPDISSPNISSDQTADQTAMTSAQNERQDHP